MDDRQFDNLTRTLARATTRRGALTAMLAGLAAGVAAMRREPAAAQDGLRLDILACLGLTPKLAAQVCIALNLPHVAKTGCVNGRCAILACQPGWANCDGRVPTGCETPLGTREHCAACGDGCARLDGICNAGACIGGSCVAQPANEGGGCDDGNPCTQTDTCQHGACTGGNPVACTALSACHEVGVCDPATGQCPHPPKPAGATCDDGDRCTVDDECDGQGTCAGTPVVCDPPRICQEAGVCNPLTGACEYAFKPATLICRPAAGPCDVDETCTGSAADCPADTFRSNSFECRAASCSNGVAILPATCPGNSAACPALQTQNCAPYVCGATACRTTCTTDNHCIASHHCDDGQCLPDEGLGDACDEDSDCVSGVCAQGVCCNAACAAPRNICSATTGGVCTPVNCASPGTCQTGPGACNPTNGQCAYPTATNGTACGPTGGQVCCGGGCCGDGEECVGDTCQAVCLALRATCDPSANQCCQTPPTDCAPTAPNCGEPGDRCCRATHGACTNACQCCGLSLCEGNRCCSYPGGDCVSADDCCSSFSGQACIEGKCCVQDGFGSETPEQCCNGVSDLDGICAGCTELGRDCDDEHPCCSSGTEPLICQATCDFDQAVCCHGPGGTCFDSCDCCGGEACANGRCCVGDGRVCAASSECCPGFECRGGRCLTEVCLVPGEACNPAQDNCCPDGFTSCDDNESPPRCCKPLRSSCETIPGVGSGCCGDSQCGDGGSGTCCFGYFIAVFGGEECAADADCCHGRCASGNCCGDQGDPCSDIGGNFECCNPFFGSTCHADGRCGPCRRLGETCDRHPSASRDTCCVGQGFCHDGKCCVSNSNACNASFECCDNAICESGECCQPDGGPCGSSGFCCGDMVCVSGACRAA